MKLLLVEDHPIVRSGCRRLLADQADEVLEAATADAGLALCVQADVVVLDLNLPGAGGLDLLPRLLAANPAARVIIFSMYEDAGFVRRAIELGAMGYVTKNDDPEALADAVRAVRRGERYLGAVAARQLALDTLQPSDPLTRRERDVLALLAAGKSLNEIGDVLSVSYRTAAAVVAALRGKLAVGSTAALIKLAVEMGHGGLKPSLNSAFQSMP
jgi:DNA-binding NarL/FixJ family response regulator